MSQQRPYTEVKDLIASLGGSMEWQPKGSGGDWLLSLRGRTATIPCRNSNVNPLDTLYVPKVAHPKTWADFEPDAPLVPDAFWRLVRAEFWRA